MAVDSCDINVERVVVMEQLRMLWDGLYSDVSTVDKKVSERLFDEFVKTLEAVKEESFKGKKGPKEDWYKDAVIYSAYVDLFNKDFIGLTEKLDYLEDLGVNCLWLLPILKSPMKDAGFDISDYKSIRPDLLGATNEQTDVFDKFVDEAHKRGIKLIFDIAMNHCSEEHPWFVEGRQSVTSEYRDYFIWSEDDQGYSDARIIFKGLCTSNWELDQVSKQYYFHRFFEIQPDLNYSNPKVLLEMTNVLVHWKVRGVDGIRADAVPYIWKEEGTICENLPKTHLVVKFFRAVLDYLQPGSLLLAEACQPPVEVVEYFGDGDECNAAYHFPVMPRIYHAMASGNKQSIEQSMASDFTPDIPEQSQWFMFLRCHDELTLEMVTPKERKFIYDSYVKDPSWDFREGEGISARLAELLEFNPERIHLANSIMMTLPGTPIVYYGDEFAKGNDVDFFNKVYEETGYADTRYLGRGEIDWNDARKTLADSHSVGAQVYRNLKHMIEVRNNYPVFGRGSIEFMDLLDPEGQVNSHLLTYKRVHEGKEVTVIQNLSNKAQKVLGLNGFGFKEDILNNQSVENQKVLELEGYGVSWLV